MGDIDAIAKAFAEHYYNTFDNNRPALQGLYQEGSMLSFEGNKFAGAAAIGEKLRSLPFQQCKHHITTIDAQPTPATAAGQGILVFISGNIELPGEAHMTKFSQAFHLLPAAGSFFVFNDIFRLNYG